MVGINERETCPAGVGRGNTPRRVRKGGNMS